MISNNCIWPQCSETTFGRLPSGNKIFKCRFEIQKMKFVGRRKLIVTSIAAEEVAPILRHVTVALEDELQPIFENLSIEPFEQLALTIFASDHELHVNETRALKQNLFDSYKDLITGQRVKTFVISIGADANILTNSDLEHCLRHVKSRFVLRLLEIESVSLQRFECDRLRHALVAALRGHE
jgi:hypothetical protein